MKNLKSTLTYLKEKIGKENQRNTLFLCIFFFIFFTLDILLQYDKISTISIGGGVYIVRTVIIWSLLLTSFYLLLGKYSKYLYTLFIPVFVLFELAELFHCIYFDRMMTGNIIFICAVSSWQETMNFIELYLTFTTVLLLLFLFSSIGFTIWYIWRTFKVKPNKYTATAGISAILLFVILETPGLFMYPSAIFSRTLLGMFCIDSYEVISHYQTLLKAMKQPELPQEISVIPAENKDKRMMGIIILGESSTKNNWGLYGYSRNTTPNLSERKAELLVWKDVVGAEADTCSALYKLLTQATVENPKEVKCTIFDVYKKAGFDVILISSQNQWGNDNGLLISLFRTATERIYLETSYDMDIFEYIKEKIRTTEWNTIFVLHTKGSHYPPERYYPQKFTPFKDVVDKENRNYSEERQNIINHYDNTVAYTDKFLNAVIEEVNKKAIPSFVFYISDHGETPRTPVWRDITHNDCWEVPMLLWASDEYRKAYPSVWKNSERNLDAPLQSDKLFWSFLSLARITCKNFPAESDIFSNRFVRKNTPRMIQHGKVEYKKDGNK